MPRCPPPPHGKDAGAHRARASAVLNGAGPELILCLTFTKAAAAEMANRIGKRLAAWVRLPEKVLKQGAVRARRAERPEDPGKGAAIVRPGARLSRWLKIQTIHSFAQGLLAAFPAEAGITPGFEPIEGRAEQELVRRTLADLMADAEASGNEGLISDVQRLSRRLGETGAVEYLQACARRPEAMAALGPPDTIAAAVGRLVDLPDESIEDYIAKRCGDEGFDCDLLRAVANANRKWGTSTGLGHAETIDDWLALTPIERAARLGESRKVVLTEKDTVKVSTGQTRAEPYYEEQAGRLAVLIARLAAAAERSPARRRHFRRAARGQAFAAAYTRAKRAAGVADFNDLIDWTRHLLKQPGMGDWVRYKLDRQVDHVLVDEAQDTNAAQWEIIEQLVEEFFSGSSESEERIAPCSWSATSSSRSMASRGPIRARFHRGAREFRRRADSLGFGDDLFTISSAPRVPRPVHRRQLPLGPADARRGRCGDRHGRPCGAGAGGAAAAAWRASRRAPGPGRAVATRSPSKSPDEFDEGEERWICLRDRYYAEALAERIRQMVEEAPFLPSTRRALTPGDILVLVRSRGELASLIVARLFSAGVPVAGVDRLQLHEPLAVQDLLAAVKFAVQPNDDLSLACLLVSPLIGWDQDQLRALAYGRPGCCGASFGNGPGSSRCARRAVRAAEDRRLHAAVALPRNHPVGPARGPAQALQAPRHGGARCDRRADEQRARVRAQRNRFARPVPRLVLARHGRGPARSRRSRRTRSG